MCIAPLLTCDPHTPTLRIWPYKGLVSFGRMSPNLKRAQTRRASIPSSSGPIPKALLHRSFVRSRARSRLPTSREGNLILPPPPEAEDREGRTVLNSKGSKGK